MRSQQAQATQRGRLLKPRVLFLDSRNLPEWRPLRTSAEVAAISLPDEDCVLNAIAPGKGIDPERCLDLASQYTGKFDLILGECTGAFLWHALFRLVGDHTPFFIIPRYNHVHPLHAYPLLLSSQLRHPQDRLFTGCGAAAHAFMRFGFQCEPSYLPGVNLKEFTVLPESRAGLRDSLGLPRDRSILLYTGRMADDKNLLDLLEVFAAVKRLRPTELVICYHFFREGYLNNCQQRAEEIGDVRIIHRPPLPALVRYYNAADLFVSAAVSFYETFGRSPVEAMACGLPPVVAEYNGFRETVTPETGFLVPTVLSAGEKRPDLSGFVETILGALTDRSALGEKVQAGVARAKHFEIEATLRTMLECLENSTDHYGASPEIPENLSFAGYPEEVRNLWPAVEGEPLAKLVKELVAGSFPDQPTREAARSFHRLWLSEF